MQRLAKWHIFIHAFLAAAVLCLAQTIPSAPGGTLSIDLRNALERARRYSQQYQSASITTALAREDRIQAKAALLPALIYQDQYIYTEGNGTPSGIFVANDGVHVYNSWANVHGDVFSVTHRAEYRRAIAAEAVARARQEIAARGLVMTVVQGYYTLVAAQRRLANAQQSLREAQRFLDITEKQERGGEVAHADVIKAQLQLQQRQRDAQDAQTNIEKARINLAVLLFPDFRQGFTVVDDLDAAAPLVTLNEMQSAALTSSPDIKAAQASLRQETLGISVARSAYLPTLTFDYWYGIDANQFATENRNGQRLLGSSAQATLTVPIWNWGSTQSKVRQAELRRQQAQLDLGFTQRQLNANISAYYVEAQAARSQLDSLRGSADLSAESLRLTILRYQAGEATALEVVDAQSTVAQARNAYDDGLVRYRVALGNIQTLTGTL